jgi:hypothetical protein
MQRWEYMTWVFRQRAGAGTVTHVNGEQPEEPVPLPQALAEAGAAGWELVSTHSEDWTTYVFKRPKP